VKCLYCEYEAKTDEQLHVHQNKFHERLLAIKGNEQAEDGSAGAVKEHPEWPRPHRNGIGFKDCPACHGVGMVTLHLPMSDERWGNAFYCPKCYPGVGAVPRYGKKPGWDMKKRPDTDELNAIGDAAIKEREARWEKAAEAQLAYDKSKKAVL